MHQDISTLKYGTSLSFSVGNRTVIVEHLLFFKTTDDPLVVDFYSFSLFKPSKNDPKVASLLRGPLDTLVH